jgi:hypothetical protein
LLERLALAEKGKSNLKDGTSLSTSVLSLSQTSTMTSPILFPEPSSEISEHNSNNEKLTKLMQMITDLKAENIRSTDKISTLSKTSVKGSNTSWEKQ